jgi:hypothetical protein
MKRFKLKKLTAFSLIVLFLLILGCSKNKNEDLMPNSTTPNENLHLANNTSTSSIPNEQGYIEIYSIDEIVVPKDEFQWNIEGRMYHSTLGEKDNLDSKNVYHMAFSTEEGYHTYMRNEIGEKYDIHKAIIEHLRDYADSSGAVAYFDEHGQVPQFYLDYEKSYLARNLPAEDLGASQQRTILAFLFKDLFCGNNFALGLPLLGTPFFIFNDNEASSFEGLLVGGYHMGFDKAFYRVHIYSLWVWGITCYNLPPAVDNQISSWWNFGI